MAGHGNVLFYQDLFRYRRVEHRDVPEILKLFRDKMTEELFGDVDISELIEMSYMSVVQLEDGGESVVACLVLCDFPNVPAVPRWCWVDWLRQHYRLERASVSNTLFVHLLVWDPRYTHQFLHPLLRFVFMGCAHLQNVIVVVPPGAKTSEDDATPLEVRCNADNELSRTKERKFDPLQAISCSNDILDELFAQIFPQPRTQFTRVQTMQLCMRQQLVPRLKMRKATEEDNDDLMPILDKTGRLAKQFGEFYVSDLIRTSDETQKIVVAEAEEKAVAIMCITSNVDYTLLGEVFELGPFNGLRRPAAVSAEPLTTQSSAEDPSNDTSHTNIPAEESGRDTEVVQHEEAAVPQEVAHKTSSVSMSRSHISDLSPEVGTSAAALVDEGTPNTFMIEIFALHEDLDERFSLDFLEAAFDCFPEFDYCIVTQPYVHSVPSLLEHFVRVPSREVFSMSAELCVAHRNAILSELVVRRVTQEDLPPLQALLGRVEKWDAILADVMSALPPAETSLQSFVISTEGSIVGLAVVSGGEDVSWLWAHYRLEDYTLHSAHSREQHGFLRHLVLSPAFNCHARPFLAEIHRQSDLTCLYHLLPSQGAVTVLGYLVPVLPRRGMQYDLARLSGSEPSGFVLTPRGASALYHMNKRFSSLRKLVVGTRVVVVGASPTALAFLERLLFGPWCVYLTFFNVCVVSRRGLPDAAGEQFLPQRSRLSHAHLSLPTWVNVVYGDVTAIDRQEKQIYVNSASVLPYDYLLFFNDEMFLKPDCKSSVLHPLTEGQDAPAREGAGSAATEMLNVFYVNCGKDAVDALMAVTSIMSELQQYNVVVYGHNVDAFCCVGVLLDHGVPGCCISFVEPISLPSMNCFDNQEDNTHLEVFLVFEADKGDKVTHIQCPSTPTHKTLNWRAVSTYGTLRSDPAFLLVESLKQSSVQVYDAVLQELRKQGVNVHSGCCFHHWIVHDDKPLITAVALEAETYCFYLECTAMFFYGNRNISDELFNVLNSAALVYDGRLVINTKFQTNDPHILAAGSHTKYARRLFADRFNHWLYNPAEVGAKVAECMIQQWDPTRSGEQTDDTAELPQTFTKPIVTNCVLPGGINYLHVRKAGVLVPAEVAMRQGDYGVVLTTGDCRNNNYFRLHLDAFNKVETVTCYNNQAILVGNLIHLYGKHERLLNNLLARFRSGRITDLYQHFSEPWAYAIFHDKFKSFQEEAREMFVLNEEEARQTSADSWGPRGQLAERVVGYVSDNLPHLPMYANPRLLRLLRHEREASPLHKQL